jgi:hypothetical protein
MFAAGKRTLLTILLACLLLTSACSRLTMDNYEKLQAGMKYEEVVALLGTPDNCDEALGARSCVWGDEKKNISVVFLAGSAAFFSHSGLR